MANYTEKLKLEKPLQEEKYNVDVFNENSNKIDAAFKNLDEDTIARTRDDQEIDGKKTFKEAPTVPDPLVDTDAANKGYVDKKVNDVENKVTDVKNSVQGIEEQVGSLDEGVVKLTGMQVIEGLKDFRVSPTVPDPTENTDAANKQYVDDSVKSIDVSSKAVMLTGDQEISGTKTFNTSPSVPTPLVDNDAVNKKYLTDQISAAIAKIHGLEKEIVSDVSKVVSDNILYLIPASESTENNEYDEYMLIEGKPERIGSTKVDLTNMVTIDTEQTISGQKTFSKPPVSTTTPTANSQLANKQYVDQAISGAGHLKYQKVTDRATAQELSAKNPDVLYYWDDPEGYTSNVTADTPIKIVVSPTKPDDIPGVTTLWVEGTP